MMLAPQVVQQKNLEQFKNNELFSYRFRSDFGTAFNKHALNLSLEYSRSKELIRENWFNGFKTTLNYRIDGFNLNGTFQYNPHSVTDLYQPDALMKSFKNYNIHSSYNFNAFHNSLKGSVLIGVNYSELYNNINQNASINLNYKITPSWAATGYANYYNFESRGSSNFVGSNSQVKLGIKKYFNAGNNKGNHKVNMQLFHDKNNNGKLDYDDEVLASEIIKLDKFVAITNKKGKVSFQNVPKGTYKLKVNENEGLRLLMDPTIQVDENKKINVALIRYNKITGKLVEVKQPYDDQETDVTGILVYVKDKDGNVKSTVVDQNNYFEFFLKDGEYEIFIENTTYQFIHPVRNVNLAKDKVTDEVIFEYKKKNKEIKIKKF